MKYIRNPIKITSENMKYVEAVIKLFRQSKLEKWELFDKQLERFTISLHRSAQPNIRIQLALF